MKSDDLAYILDYDIQFYTISLCISELLMNTQVSCNQKIMLSACESHKETMSKVNIKKDLDVLYVCDSRSLSNLQDNKSGYVGGEIVL